MLGTVYQWIMDPGAPVSELHLDLKELIDGRYGVRGRRREGGVRTTTAAS
jgi:hypothetical protein